MCVFLLSATALSYLDRQALSIVAPRVGEELELDNAQLGVLLSAFFYSYGAMHLVVGYFLDRFNIRFTYAFFVAFWSLAQILTGLVSGFEGLIMARVLLGGFEAAGQPGAARIIARILPAEDRSFANGIMMSGGSLGAVLAPLLMIGLANTIGWRTGFIVLGAIGVLWAIAWVSWFRPGMDVLKGPPRTLGAVRPEDRWGTILRGPKFWACTLGALFGVPIIHVASAWIPTYFVQQWNMPLGAGLGGYLFLIYLGLDLGFLGGGAAVTGLVRRGLPVGRARKLVMTVSAVLMVLVAAVPWSPSIEVAVLLIFLLNVGRASWGANFLAFNQDIAAGRVGTMAGTMGAIGAFSGALLVWGIGVISKEGGFTVPFLMVGSLAVLGLIPLLLVRWDPSDPRREEMSDSLARTTVRATTK